MLGGIEIIRDPVHGFIELDELEIHLIDTCPFRRLGRIRQLALTSHVYPGAEHTRFQHSLGVMHLAGIVFDLLDREADLAGQLHLQKEELSEWRRALRCAALLHDLGHAPFSHAGEELLPGGRKHEIISRDLILAPEVSGLLAEGDVDPRKVAALLDKTGGGAPPLLQQILAGDLDVDRMDYLARDSLFTGVKYGVFDTDRLIRCLTVCDNPEEGRQPQRGEPILALREGGIHAGEALVLARYYMFTQVYFNKVRRAYDLALSDFLKKALPGGRYPADLDEYLKWDDTRVWQLALGKEQDIEAARRIVRRDHLRVAFETPDHPDQTELRTFPACVSEFASQHPDIVICEDSASTHPHRFEEAPFWIVGEGESRHIMDVSGVIEALKPVRKMRVYCAPEDIDTVKAHFLN